MMEENSQDNNWCVEINCELSMTILLIQQHQRQLQFNVNTKNCYNKIATKNCYNRIATKNCYNRIKREKSFVLSNIVMTTLSLGY